MSSPSLVRFAWGRRLLVLGVVVIAYGAGWWSGKNGSFVRSLIAITQTVGEVNGNLDAAMRSLGSAREEAERLLTEKADLEGRLRSLERRLARAPKAAPVKPVRPSDQKRCRLWSRGGCS